MDNVHLQRFDLKVPVIAAIWASQRHERSPFTGACTDLFGGIRPLDTNLDSMCWAGAAQ
jgi:hypothetical protein